MPRPCQYMDIGQEIRGICYARAMDTLIKLVIALAIFAAGYTLGQGHRMFDYNGDGRVDKADFMRISDDLLDRA